MNSKLRDICTRAIAAVEAKDVKRFLALLEDEAYLFDPHYPYPHMEGKKAIEAGLRWSLASIREFHFKELNYMERADGTLAAIEYACRHILPNGKELTFRQVFIIAIGKTGLITRLMAYEPYGPHGIPGLMLKISHFFYRLRHPQAANFERRITDHEK